MASTTGFSSEIHMVQTVSGNQTQVRRIIEKAGNVFLQGVPVMIDAGGGVKEWDGATIARGIAGFGLEPGNNLATLGVPKTLSFGSVPNESSAVNIPRGAPLNDGKLGFELGNDDTIFKGQVGTSVAVTDVGVQYGMTKDTDNHWYVDKSKSTVGTNTVVVIVALDPNDQAASPRGCYFKVVKAAQQLSS